MGAGTSAAEQEFFCLGNHATFRELRNGCFSPNLVMKHSSVSHRWIPKDIFEYFHFMGHLPPKSDIEMRSKALHSEQATGHEMHYREIRFISRCSPRAREFPRLVNFFVRRTVAELRCVNVPQFSDFGLFSPYQTPKTYLPVTSLQPRGYIAEWLRFFHVIVEDPKGCLPGMLFSCNFW